MSPSPARLHASVALCRLKDARLSFWLYVVYLTKGVIPCVIAFTPVRRLERRPVDLLPLLLHCQQPTDLTSTISHCAPIRYYCDTAAPTARHTHTVRTPPAYKDHNLGHPERLASRSGPQPHCRLVPRLAAERLQFVAETQCYLLKQEHPTPHSGPDTT